MKVKVLKSGISFTNAEGRLVSPLKDTHVEVADGTGQGLVDGGMAEKVSGGNEETVEEQPVEGQAAAPNAIESAVEEAEERGVDISQVDGTGKDGRITQPDVVRFAQQEEEREASGPAETTASAGPEETR